MRSAAAATVLRRTSVLLPQCARCHAPAAALVSRFSTTARRTSALVPKHNPHHHHTATSPSSPPRRFLSQQPPRRADSAEKPAAAATHYDLFPSTLPLGPPPRGHFPIQTRALRREFLALQARAHPDMHPPGPAKTRAEALSARINEAYRTLANPLLRAQYLLALRGVDVANDERLKVDEPALLMVVLEAREEIEEARAEEDLHEVRTANEARIADGEEALERAFRDDDVEAAKREAVRMRYWVNIRESLDNWEPGKPIVLQH
ncbi:co-chaperone protein HscB [Cordyceps militaris CM01]|uniref:Co-chaperone protein HscB n=1 Tax=Cordyceps militaris (strain CM01) TaxID=983644 RepID=G3JHP6_CORMM|nr:co-chaperone protein HscB [Cordyceps militaris CM01]EGX91752.1 co-chaperone protein HscB [Cordyceps militaris CM01]